MTGQFLNRDTERMFAYHEATKHTFESIYGRRHTLDWASMPDPFRHYEGVPVIDLPADPPSPPVPALEVLRGRGPGHPRAAVADGAAWLSQLLFHSAAISASKKVPSTGYRYSLRVNPSSGNLHPTEFHFATQGLAGWEDGLYHYRPSCHMAEQRARGAYVEPLADTALAPWFRQAPVLFAITSIAWREAWKYRSRAYRYCLHDAGHAWQSLALAARALGCEAFALGHFHDDKVSELLGLTDEWPMMLVAIQGPAAPVEAPRPPAREWFGGAANQLSAYQEYYPLIDAIHLSSKLESEPLAQAEPPCRGSGRFELAALADSDAAFGEVVRRRRSALDFIGGPASISFEQLSTLLQAAVRPFQADFEGDLFNGESSRYVQLYVYAHRVRGLECGVYRHWPEPGQLEALKTGDQRRVAAALSLGQDLAGNACVAFSMIADLPRASRWHGNRGYRYGFFEAGAIGQRLYIASEAMGFRSTGIGAFFDDDVHSYLDIRPEQGQVIYHFACGYAVPDERLEG